MQRRTTLIGATTTLAVAALALAGCGAAPEGDDAIAVSSDFLPCAASDLTGFDDGDFSGGRRKEPRW